jgi:hypothetical protein
MINKLFLKMLPLILLFGCDNSVLQAEKRQQSNEKSVWEEVARRVGDHFDTIVRGKRPRIVPRGAKPEVVISGTSIFINGTAVAIGQPIKLWKNAIGGSPRCDEEEYGIKACDWDDLGISLLAKGELVGEFIVHVNLENWWPEATQRPDGTPIPPLVDWRPKHPFPGYLELDGYGIDAKTEYWEIRASAAPERKLHCDIGGNCGDTEGYFDGKSSMFLSLNRTTSERGNLDMFTIATEIKPDFSKNKPVSRRQKP